MYQNHRAMAPVSAQAQQQLNARLIELLDAVKLEFDNVTQEAGMFKMHKDEYEHKISSQMAEMQSVRQNIYELEIAHQKIKQQYEEEISRLRNELDARSGGSVPGAHMHSTTASSSSSLMNSGPVGSHQPPQSQSGGMSGPPPPSLGHGPSNLFGGIMSGQGSLPDSQQNQQQQQQQQQAASQQSYGGYTNGKSGPGGYAGNAGQPGGISASPNPAHSQQSKRSKVSTTPQPSMDNRTAPSYVSRTSPPPPPGSSLGDLDLQKVPPPQKKEGEDWWVIYNPKVMKSLDVDLVHSLDHSSVVCCVRFSADGKYVATGCNKSAQIFDVQTGQRVSLLQDEAADREGDLYIRSVCFSPDGKYLATGAEDKQIRIWDIKTGRIRHTFTGHEQDIYSLDFARNGRHIASGSGDRTARVWDMETGQCMMTLSIEDGVTTVAISPDGRYVAAGSLDKVVRVWDAQSGYLVERLEGHKDSVYSVAFAPNGKDLVSGSLDKTIKLWELGAPRGQLPGTGPKGGVCTRTFYGHKDFVLSVALTPDGAWVVSGSKDRGVQFWSPTTGLPIFMLQGHKNSVISVATSSNGSMFATGSGDCKARIWQYSPV